MNRDGVDELYCDGCGKSIGDEEEAELLNWGLDDFALICGDCLEKARRKLEGSRGGLAAGGDRLAGDGLMAGGAIAQEQFGQEPMDDEDAG